MTFEDHYSGHSDAYARYRRRYPDALFTWLASTIPVVHRKQLLTYLRLMNLRVGLLLNFGEATLKQGLHRMSTPSLPPRLRVSA